MRKTILKRFQSPVGQVLVATLLFFSIFLVLFVGLFKAGQGYVLRERANRSGDLTALSCGAVYANGLQLVRYTNVALMAAATADLATILSAYLGAGGPASGPIAVDLALTADPHYRADIQRIQDVVFGIDLTEKNNCPGAYPLLIWGEGSALARDNDLQVLPPLQPLLLFNFEKSGLIRSAIPHMALRFRTADELLTETGDELEKAPLYRLHERVNGNVCYFGPDQVEPAPNARNGQMRVRCDTPSPYRCKYVEEVIAKTERSVVKWTLAKMKEVLKNIRLDVTHRDKPHQHTLLLACRPITRLPDGNPVEQWSESILIGGGLAGWDVLSPPFKVRLKSIDPKDLPWVKDLLDRFSHVFQRWAPQLNALLGGQPQ